MAEPPVDIRQSKTGWIAENPNRELSCTSRGNEDYYRVRVEKGNVIEMKNRCLKSSLND